MRLACSFVEGKVNNLRVALLRAARREDDMAAAAAADLLVRLVDGLSDAGNLNGVLGVEGTASREYFQALRRMLDPEWELEGRQRRPPPDPVNAMLSYGYTLLTHQAVAAAEAAGLDPTVGFLHQHRWGRPALALDLIEEFRPVTVDVAVWRCITPRRGSSASRPRFGRTSAPVSVQVRGAVARAAWRRSTFSGPVLALRYHRRSSTYPRTRGPSLAIARRRGHRNLPTVFVN